MAWGSVLQSTSGTRVSGVTTNAVAYASNLTSGSFLIAVVNSETPQTFTVADTLSNTWVLAKRQEHASTRATEIWYCLSAVSSSACTVTATASANATYRLSLLECSYTGTATVDQTNGVANTNVATQLCAPAGAIDTAANVLVISSCMTNSSSTFSPNANYTAFGAGNTSRSIQAYRLSATALTDDDAAITTGGSVSSAAAIASFTTDAATVARKLFINIL